MDIKISAFKNKEFIPLKYTCDGENVSPMIDIINIPDKAKSLALIVDDPDATVGDNWNHWILWNIDPKSKYIYEDNIPLGSIEGTNSFGRLGYGGPCPPKNSKPHRYFFKAYALDVEIDLKEGSTKEDLEKAMENHIIDKSEIIGLYQRK